MSRRDRILALALPKQNEVTISSLSKTPSPEIAHKPPSPETTHKPPSPEIAHIPPSPETAHKPFLPMTKNVPSLSDTACSHGYHVVGSTTQRSPIVTDIKAIWSRPYNFIEYKSIFDYKNEYRNSYDIVHDIDTTLFSKPETQISHFNTRGSLFCFETMPSDDEEINQYVNVDIYEDSDDSAKDQNYEPELRVKKKKFNFTDTILQSPCEVTAPMSFIVPAEVHEMPVDSSERCHDALPETEENYTKSGAQRKRRKYDTPLSQRLQEKKKRNYEKLTLKKPCTEKCRLKCTNKITQEEREKIHNRYLNLNWESRGLFIKGLVEPLNVKLRTVKENLTYKRNVSYKYMFFVNREKIEVCKTYFLTTLGYHPQNNTHLHRILGKPVDEQKDKRGSYERINVIDKDLIKTHIRSYKPVVSHYRREHAPLKLYLPSDITITSMHQNFTEGYPNIKVSFETYRRMLRELNISFAHLGNEECEQCAVFKSHEDSNECSQDPSCEKCLVYHKHNFKYKTAREAYKADVIAAATDEEIVYYSVDLQKVIMLPRMDQYKIAIFCPRIIAFNESFVPLGKTKDNKMPYAVLWNETISGRNQEDIISTFMCFLLHKRDAKHIVIWADNCAAQNKNWMLICFLVNMVNSGLTAVETITMKYFEPGHTYMSADHFHHQVELSLKKKKKVYDFDDFVDAVRNANSRKNNVHVMSVSDFKIFEDSTSLHKIKNIQPRIYLRDIMSLKAEKGHYCIKFKDNLELDWKELDFLQVKVKKNQVFPNIVPKSAPRGITKERKEDIIAKLVPLMPVNRRVFWNSLPESTKIHPNLAEEN